jgi:hypothetical protein
MPKRTFGHSQTGWIVEFELAGVACQSLTVETESEAAALRNIIESEEGVSAARVTQY